MPNEQGHAKFGFQLTDVAREGRLRDVQTLGGPRHVQRVRYSDEGANMSKVHGGGILYQKGITLGQRCIGLASDCRLVWRSNPGGPAMRGWKSVVLAVALCFAPAAAFAQATLAGVVKDSSGAVLPGVTIEASSPVLIEKA